MRTIGRNRERKGQVVVLAPVIVFALGVILCLTVDVGNLSVWRARLQNTADAAALAGAQVLVSQQVAGMTEGVARSAACIEARLIQHASTAEADAIIDFGTIDTSGNFTTQPLSQRASAVRVKAVRNATTAGGPVRLAFASLIGMRSCDVAGTAVAQGTANIGKVFAGLMPFAVPEDRLVPPGQEMVFYPCDGAAYDYIVDRTVVPGCFGLLNLDGGSLGTTELVNWIQNGYPNAFEISPDPGYIWIGGTSGFRAALEKPMQQKIGQEIVMPIYDQVTGVGANANFRCIGFVHGVLTEVNLTGKPGCMRFRVGEITMFRNVGCGGSYPSPNIRRVRLCG